ncbi:SRPBCC family protein [Sphaerisporangium aureirubrum]|uniref:SRPBCC family protein n=1 Tax=Sphaerisporangium aureirubrum TaxID=1544736 RepID=A0ABW1NBU0_9ACTN
MIDTTEQISAVERTIGSRVLEAGEARVLTASQTYDAPIEEVWDALTDIERIPRWFLPITGDLRVGGSYQLEGNASGKVERCDAPTGFAATWEFGGQVSWIEVRLSPAPGGGTRFELEHIAHVDEAMWAQFGPGGVGIGWDSALLGLTSHFAAEGEGVDPAQAAEWVASDDGKRFMALSSERWAEASIAAGTDEAEARAAAGRVLAMYTGEGPGPEM